jgi:hypothetical protein
MRTTTLYLPIPDQRRRPSTFPGIRFGGSFCFGVASLVPTGIIGSSNSVCLVMISTEVKNWKLAFQFDAKFHSSLCRDFRPRQSHGPVILRHLSPNVFRCCAECGCHFAIHHCPIHILNKPQGHIFGVWIRRTTRLSSYLVLLVVSLPSCLFIPLIVFVPICYGQLAIVSDMDDGWVCPECQQLLT